MSCADHFKAGRKKNGYYSIQEQTSSRMLVVYCDFESEPGMAWTLAMSYSLINLQNMPGRPLVSIYGIIDRFFFFTKYKPQC